jgi:hypothetical protein
VQTEGQGDEGGASLDLQGVCSDFHRGFFTILDNVVTVGESAGGEEQAGWPHPHPGGLQEGAEGVCEKLCGSGFCHGTLAVIQALREVCHNLQWECQENLQLQIVLAFTAFYL